MRKILDLVRSHKWLLGILAAHLALLSFFFDYVPLWDSKSYIETCLQPAIAKPFNLLNFDCSNHGTLIYSLWMTAGQWLFFGSNLAYHLSSYLLILPSIVGFYFLLQRSTQYEFSKVLGLLLFSFNPVIISNTINTSPDFAVLCFGIGVVLGLLAQSFWAVMLFGFGMCFSKESGVATYGLFLFLFAILNRDKISLKRTLLVVLPFLVYAFYIWFKINHTGKEILFDKKQPTDLFKMFFNTSADSISALYGIFVVNFQWVTSAVIAGVGLPILIFMAVKKRGSWNKEKAFVILSFLISAYGLTRYPHYLNIRYYMIVFPLMILTFIFCIDKLSPRLRVLILILITSATFASNFKTIDFVSKNIFGTFKFGDHKLLKMTSITGECCGFGRDQLIYNLEHTQIHYLYSRFAKDIRLNPRDAIIRYYLMDFGVTGYLNKETLERTTNPQGAFYFPHFFDASEYLSSPARPSIGRVFYIDFANASDENHIERQKKLLSVKGLFEVENSGYKFRVVEFAARPF